MLPRTISYTAKSRNGGQQYYEVRPQEYWQLTDRVVGDPTCVKLQCLPEGPLTEVWGSPVQDSPNASAYPCCVYTGLKARLLVVNLKLEHIKRNPEIKRDLPLEFRVLKRGLPNDVLFKIVPDKMSGPMVDFNLYPINIALDMRGNKNGNWWHFMYAIMEALLWTDSFNCSVEYRVLLEYENPATPDRPTNFIFASRFITSSAAKACVLKSAINIITECSKEQPEIVPEFYVFMRAVLNLALTINALERLDGNTGHNPTSDDSNMDYGNADDPDMDDPEMDDPDMEDPEMDDPDMDDPDMEDPDMEDPDMDDPDMDGPDMDGPDMHDPNIHDPDMEDLDMDDPDMEDPDMDDPDMDGPDMDGPDMHDPNIHDPDMHDPNIHDPDNDSDQSSTVDDEEQEEDEQNNEDTMDDAYEDSNEDATEYATEDVYEHSNEVATEDANEDVIEHFNEDGTEDAYEDSNEDGTEDAYGDSNEDGTEDAYEDSNEDGTEDPSEDATEDAFPERMFGS